MKLSGPLPEKAVNHCHELVRLQDKDRYVASLFMPDGKRELVWALYAMNIELARIRELVSEATLGEMRLQWWKQSIRDIFDGHTADHPVLQLLARAIEAGDLQPVAFANMIEARQFDLYEDPMPSLNDLEGYLGETNSMLVQMAAQVLTGGLAESCAEVSGLGGVAHGMTGLARSLPIHRTRGQCFLPKDLLDRHGLTPAHVLSARGDAALEALLSDYLDHAEVRLSEARRLANRIPLPAKPAYLHLALIDADVRTLRRLKLDVLTQLPQQVMWQRQLKLWWMNFKARF